MAYDHNNIFARIIKGEIPSEKVYEDPFVLAIRDVAPAAPVHVLIMPKAKYVSFDDFAAHAPQDLITHLFKTIGVIAKRLEIVEGGYRLITNHGANAAQSVPHFHVHLLAGKPLGGLLPDDALTR
jgi:diadenosine tetraphosphate (Ap4A) HIT family hydrolase